MVSRPAARSTFLNVAMRLAFFFLVGLIVLTPSLQVSAAGSPKPFPTERVSVAGTDPSQGDGLADTGHALNSWEHIVSRIPSSVGRSQAAVDQYCRNEYAVYLYKAQRAGFPYINVNGWWIWINRVNWVWGHANFRVCVWNW